MINDGCHEPPTAPTASIFGVMILDEKQGAVSIPELCDAEGHYIVPEHGSVIIEGIEHCVFVMVAVCKASSESVPQLPELEGDIDHGHGFRYGTSRR